MIPPRAHALLSDLHRLLSNYSPAEFREAALFSEQLQEPLQALATKTALANAETIVSEIGKQDTEASVGVRSASKTMSRHYKSVTPEFIENLLRRAGVVEAPSGLQQIAKHLALNVLLRPKDGRDRNLRKVSRAIAHLHPSQRSRVLNELGAQNKTQTEGWIDVIKGTK